MSFVGECAVRYLGNQFQYCLVIGCIKTPTVLKRQQFEDSESDITEQKLSKLLCVDEHDNSERQSSDKYQGKGGRYVLLPSCPQKESNRLTDLG